jgi:hypothetical protein
MQCKDFESVLEQEGLHPLPLAARSHLAECSACQNLFADLSIIVSTAKVIPAEVEPPQRMWVSLRAQMEAEGLIRESVASPAESAAWWQGLSTLFRPRVLATAGAGLALAFAAFLTVHRNPGTTTKTNAPAPVAVAEAPAPAKPPTAQPSSDDSVTPAPAPQVTARAKSPSNPASATSHGLKPSPSDSLYGADTLVGTHGAEQFPAGASLRGSVEADASLRDNLRVINGVIAECQKYLKKHPNDELAREYLASAYQQKAQLVAAILDSGRSEQ